MKEETTTMREEKFWLVYTVSNGAGHDTLQAAMAEAEKLAKKHPGHKFYVMEPVAGKVAHSAATSLLSVTISSDIVFGEGGSKPGAQYFVKAPDGTTFTQTI